MVTLSSYPLAQCFTTTRRRSVNGPAWREAGEVWADIMGLSPSVTPVVESRFEQRLECVRRGR
jgi:hypothetical protein